MQRLFELVAKWKAEGKAIIFVSHRMEEIFQIADQYSVLRNGKTVGAGNIKDINEKDLVKLMIEKISVFQFYAAMTKDGQSTGESPYAWKSTDLQTACFTRGRVSRFREGELVGIGGLQGRVSAIYCCRCLAIFHFTGTIKLFE